jgi:hypothetical protein
VLQRITVPMILTGAIGDCLSSWDFCPFVTRLGESALEALEETPYIARRPFRTFRIRSILRQY